MKIDILNDILNFHLKFGLGRNMKPTVPSAECVKHRINMTKEEAGELVEALESGDLVKIARECVDLLMVVFGHILVYGLPFNNIWRAVHQANMRKTRSQDNTKASKPHKPPGWQSPDKAIRLALGVHKRPEGAVPAPVDTVVPAVTEAQEEASRPPSVDPTPGPAAPPAHMEDDTSRDPGNLAALEADLNSPQ